MYQDRNCYDVVLFYAAFFLSEILVSEPNSGPVLWHWKAFKETSESQRVSVTWWRAVLGLKWPTKPEAFGRIHPNIIVCILVLSKRIRPIEGVAVYTNWKYKLKELTDLCNMWNFYLFEGESNIPGNISH